MRGDHLHFRFSGAAQWALADVSVALPQGQMTAFVGPNGSGKSTLLHCLTGTWTPVQGVVTYATAPLSEWSATQRAQHIALVQQAHTAAPLLTVQEIVRLGRTPFRRLWQAWTPQDERAVQDALQVTGLADLAGRSYTALSGGQQQRVWLALALAQEPAVIFLDEPTTFLDIHYQLALLQTLQQLQRSRGLTVGIILHDLNQVLQFADQVYCLQAGRVVAAGPPAAVLQPALVQAVFGVRAETIQTPQQHAALVFY
ncbi:FepC [Schleiferilactobacillus shenzhenensis LY-73]|uniref:FepC n=2 Tax=Schleiferilactobacillus shenzhenensis TaxID=1231337 RepID=U4TVU8_9LACO|nr:FepC [Schleiferilactobacillus shenzhenensis LY-73]